MKDTVIIIHAEKVEYSRKSSDGTPTGELVSFCRIKYLSDEPDDDSRYKGYAVSEGQGPVEIFGQLELLPGLYEVRFRKTQVRDRYDRQRVGLEPVSVELVGDPGLVFEPQTAAGAK
jgi:hypothetical protein